jgi:uncharacterized protein YgiM (DUF1202 family)
MINHLWVPYTPRDNDKQLINVWSLNITRENTRNTGTTTINLNLRDAPANTGNVIEVIPAGTRVRITGDASSGWIPVRYNNQDGWVWNEHLSTE